MPSLYVVMVDKSHVSITGLRSPWSVTVSWLASGRIFHRRGRPGEILWEECLRKVVRRREFSWRIFNAEVSRECPGDSSVVGV